MTSQHNQKMVREIREFVRRDFHPRFGELKDQFASHPAWKQLRELGTELWFDTGDIDAAERMWNREITALTTNNTLLNKEVQTGVYDDLILQADDLLSSFTDLDDRQRRLEMAFILNAHHGLRLVERFDAFVSVEEHTDLASDLDEAVYYAMRYHDVCPERFIVKIPFTPAGILATRKVVRQGITVNHTLGFSARQNYVVARLAKPAFVNVFLGRLNSFIADNGLGSGDYVGEKATLASQQMIRMLHEKYGISTRQIAASLRAGTQIRDLAGVDVMTMPLKAAREFLELKLAVADIVDKTYQQYAPGLSSDVNVDEIRLGTLWNVQDRLVSCVDALEQEDIDSFTPDDLVNFFTDHHCGDILVKWQDEEMTLSTREGKIPELRNWKNDLTCGRIGLDSLMNLAGLNSFITDQMAMDARVLDVLARKQSV